MNQDSKQFMACLREGSAVGLQSIPKSDLHNHAGRGGCLRYISDWVHMEIMPPDLPFVSLDEMQEWFEQNIKIHCPGIQGYLKRVEAAFAQAGEDGIACLAISFGLGEIDLLGGMHK
jgi:adenosine deaminase